MFKKVSKPKLTMRLFWESKDLRYDKQDRKKYSKIRRVVNKMDNEVFKKVILRNKDYEFYKGVCFINRPKEVLNYVEYNILLAVIYNIRTGYYDGGNYDKEEKIYSKN